MHIWRISNYADLSGRGGLVAAGRWHDLGTPVIYCTDHPAAAMLEMIVHLDLEDLPANFKLLRIELPDTLLPFEPPLPAQWRDEEQETRRIGSRFIKKAAEPVMKVPSIIVPFCWNYILNPTLVGRSGIEIVEQTSHDFDHRLVG